MYKKFLLLSFLLLNTIAYSYNYQISGIDNVYPTSYWYTDSRGILYLASYENGELFRTYSASNLINYNILYNINKRPSGYGYISRTQFMNLYKNDLIFLNDLYTQVGNAFLNFLYNDTNFSNSYIEYEDFELLYNSDGYAVESIVDGVWAGLYDDNQKSISGYMYNSIGILMYYNGEPVNYFQSLLSRFIDILKNCISEVFSIIASPIGIIVSVVFVLVLMYYVVVISRNCLSKEPTKWTSSRRRKLFGNHDDLHGF